MKQATVEIKIKLFIAYLLLLIYVNLGLFFRFRKAIPHYETEENIFY